MSSTGEGQAASGEARVWRSARSLPHLRPGQVAAPEVTGRLGGLTLEAEGLLRARLRGRRCMQGKVRRSF